MAVPVGDGPCQVKPKAFGIIEQPFGGGCENENAFVSMADWASEDVVAAGSVICWW